MRNDPVGSQQAQKRSVQREGRKNVFKWLRTKTDGSTFLTHLILGVQGALNSRPSLQEQEGK